MKALLTTTVLLVSTSALACPQLSGRYSCNFGDSPKELKVEQRKENNVEIYKVIFEGMSEEFITDGKVRTIERDGEKIDFSATCKNDQVVATLLSVTADGALRTDITVKQKASKDVTMIYEMREPESNEVLAREQIECKKN